jgi:O-antigen/teichoic acid export membrane protein
VIADRPDETEAERADRNFLELLQELRVVQTGVQILFAFLLTLPFQSAFEKLDGFQKDLYVAAILLAVGSVICLVAPVAYHRALFRRGLKDKIVKVADRFAMAGVALLGAAIVVSVGLVLDVVLGQGAALGYTVLVAVAVVGIWILMPLYTRREHRRGAPPDPDGD